MLLQLYEEHDEIFLSKIFATHETWVFHYTPGNKADSVSWKHPHTAVKKKVKTVQSPGKGIATVFWDIHGVI
jgi:hypothetical protein